MKKWLTLLAGALFAGAAIAADITEAQARTVAENFVTKDSIGMSVLPDRTVDTVTKRGGFYLVTLKPSGHLLVSVNRSAEPIPSFSENDFTEPEVGSPQAAFLAVAETNAIEATGTKYETQWKTLLGQKVLRLTTSSTSTYIAPLLQSSWSQDAPYYDFAPVNNGTHEPNGCVGTAYSQIMRYWGWPEKIDEDFSTVHSADSTWGFTQQLWAGTELNWADMPLSGYSTEAHRLDIGRATMLCGMLAKMGYAIGGSGAQNKDVSRNPWYTTPNGLDCDGTNAEALKTAIVTSLNAKCPILVGIGKPDHSIVCDGCSESSGTFYIHLNYGWGGTDTANYTLDSVMSAKALSSIYHSQRPRPMVLADAMAAESTLPLTLKWAFPKKGYEDALTGFTVKYAEVDSNVYDWEDNFSSVQGVVDGADVAVETISCNNSTPVLNIRNAASQAHYTWPAKVLRADSKLSFRVRSNNAIGMKVVVQAYNPSTGWETIYTPVLAEKTVSDWQDIILPLPQYAEKAIGLRVGAQRVSLQGASGYDDIGVQFDDFKITNVRNVSAALGSIDVTADARSCEFTSSRLSNDKTYVFTVEPKVTGGVISPAVSTKIVSSTPTGASIDAIASVRTTGYQVQQGFYREGYLGLNQFGVYGSEATTGLVVRLSHPVLIDKSTRHYDEIFNEWITVVGATSVVHAVSVEKVKNGKFLVKLDFGMLTTYLRYTRMVVTFDALDAKGNVARKHFNLLLNNLGGETAVTKEQLPDYGGSASEPEPVYYYVYFDSTGGSAIASKQVESGKAVGALTEPTKSGYTFAGWFTASTGGTQVTPYTVISKSVTFYAQWNEIVVPGGDDPVNPPSGGDDPVVDPTSGNANDFTEGSKTYRFCNGVNKTSGFYDVNRIGTLTYQIPSAYNLVLWWAESYKTAKGSYPTGYTAPNTSSLANDGTSFSLQARASELFASAVGKALMTSAERESFFPSVQYTAANWYGSGAQSTWTRETGKKIYAYLAQGPIGILAATSSSRTYGGVIWGCEYATDSDGKYATVLYITSTKSNNDNLENYTLANVTVSGIGTMPGLKSFNTNGGVITTFYPIVGPAISDDPDPGDDPDEPGDDPDPGVDPDEPGDEPDDPPVTPSDDEAIGVADNSSNPGNDYTASYGYEMYDNYWTARKRAMKQGKQLFVLSGAAWCSNCAFVKDYLKSLGDEFSDQFVVYYSDNDSTACNCFRGGLPQYGAADPRTVDAFTGTLNGGVRSWDIAWQTDTSGIYRQDRGGYDPKRVDAVVGAGKYKANYGTPTNLVIRGLSTLGTGKSGRYELFAQYADGVEMPVDYGVDWQVVSGNGTFADANVDGRDVGSLTVSAGSVVIRARSTFYFTGTKTMTVDCAPESDIVSVEIITDEVNLEDNATPTIEAEATLKSGKKIPVFGFGTWTATFKEKLPRTECPELDENDEGATSPSITIDGESRLNYATTDGLLKVCDQKIDVTLTVNGKTTTKTITVWGPTKVIPSQWSMVSGPTQTTRGVVRLSCSELKYNYGGKIKTTKDTYFASYEIVMKSGNYSAQPSYLRGLTAYVDNYGATRDYKIGLRTKKVNGKYTGYLPANPESAATAPTVTCLVPGSDKTDIAKGAVPEGFFKAFFPTRNDYATLADEDSDGDGFKNWEEYVLGTDPTNKGDAFTLMQGYQHLTAPAGNGATMQYKVMYQQRARRIYYIDAKKTWGEDWTHVATVSLQDMTEKDVTTFTDLDATYADNAKFFRVRAALYDHEFNYPDTKPIIAPNMLVANRDAVIDLTSETLPLALSSFDTDATDPGTVWVKVAANTPAGTALISAPKSAVKSLQACQPKDSGDVQFEVIDDPDDDARMILKIAGEDHNVNVSEGTQYIIGAEAFGERVFHGSGTIKMAQTSTGGKANLSDLLSSANFADDFTGTIELGAGRYVYTADCVPTRVKISVVDGAQLFVSDGVTIPNAVTISGNGWGGEVNYVVSQAALRLGNNAVLTGVLTVNGETKIGVHTGNTATINAAVAGNGTLVKIAPGTLLLGAVTGSNFSGRFKVGEGVVKANASSVNFFGCGADAKAIIVESGATFDMNGKHSADLTIELNGGKLTNTASGIDSGKKTIRKIILTADSRIEGSQNYGLIANQYGKAYLDLQGHTLTFAMSSGKDFWLPNVEVSDGTIDIVSGRFYTWKTLTTFAGTVKVSGGEFKVQGPATVDNLVLAGGSVTDSAMLTINGTLDVASSTTINRAFTLGDDAKVNLADGVSLTVKAAQRIAPAKFSLPAKCRLVETQGDGTYTYTIKRLAPFMLFIS